MRLKHWLVGAVLLTGGCAGSGSAPPRQPVGRPVEATLPPALPDSGGFGIHVLALARSPDTALWAGTFGKGIYVLEPSAKVWRRINLRANDSTSLPWDFV